MANIDLIVIHQYTRDTATVNQFLAYSVIEVAEEHCFILQVQGNLKTSGIDFIEKLVMMVQLKMSIMASFTRCFQDLVVSWQEQPKPHSQATLMMLYSFTHQVMESGQFSW